MSRLRTDFRFVHFPGIEFPSQLVHDHPPPSPSSTSHWHPPTSGSPAPVELESFFSLLSFVLGRDRLLPSYPLVELTRSDKGWT